MPEYVLTEFPSGGVVFGSAAGTLTADSTNFYWDATNHRLGIRANAPASTLAIGDNGNSNWQVYIKGQGTSSATYGIVDRDSGGSDLFWVRDDGMVYNKGPLAVNSTIYQEGAYQPWSGLWLGASSSGQQSITLGMPYGRRLNMLRFYSPTATEYWNGSNWATWSGPNFTYLTDDMVVGGNNITIDATHAKFRLTYQVDSWQEEPYALIVYGELWGEPTTVTFEDSYDGTNWTTRTNVVNTTYAHYWVIPIAAVGGNGYYVRIGFDMSAWVTGGGSTTMNEIELLTSDSEAGGYPAYATDVNRNISFIGNFYPGTGSATQSSRYIYDDGTYTRVSAGFSVDGNFIVASNGTVISGVWNGTNIGNSYLAGPLVYSFAGLSNAVLFISPNGTLSLGTSGSNVTADINLSHANTWAAVQNFGTNYLEFGGKIISIASSNIGDIIYDNGTNWVALGIGTNTQVLSVATNVPAWVNATNVGQWQAGYVSSLSAGLSIATNVLTVTFPTVVTSLGAQTGAITLSSGLSMVGSVLTVTFPTVVTSFGAKIGAITLGSGLSMTNNELDVTFPTVVTSLNSLTGAVIIRSPNGTLSIGTSGSNVTADINLGHSNTWTAAQTINALLSIQVSGTTIMTLGGDANGSIEIGPPASSTVPFVDWHSSGNSTDYDFRMQASGGTNATGGGNMNFVGAAFTFNSNTIAVLSLAQNWTAVQNFGNYISIGGAVLNVSGLATNNYLQYNGTNWINAAAAEQAEVTGVTNWSGAGAETALFTETAVGVNGGWILLPATNPAVTWTLKDYIPSTCATAWHTLSVVGSISATTLVKIGSHTIGLLNGTSMTRSVTATPGTVGTYSVYWEYRKTLPS